MKRRQTQAVKQASSSSSPTLDNNKEKIRKVLWDLTEKYFPWLKIVLEQFKSSNRAVVFIIIALVLTTYPFWNLVKEFADNFWQNVLTHDFSSVLAPEELSAPPRRRWVWRQNEILNITNRIKKLSEEHDGKQVHMYLVGGPGSGKSELARQVGLTLYESLKQDKRPVDVIRLETENIVSLESSLIDAVFSLCNSSGQRTDGIKQMKDELNFRFGDLFSNEGNILKIEMKLKILFSKLKDLLKQRNSRPVLIFDNVRDLKLLMRYVNLEPGSRHFTTFIIILTLNKRISLERLSDYAQVMDLYEGMTTSDSVKLLRLITGLEEDSEDAKQLSDILGRQPLALASAAIYIESVREGPPTNTRYSYSEYLSEFKRDIHMLGKEEEVEWQESDVSKYSDAMYIAVLKAVNRSAQIDPVLRDIACGVGYADSSQLSLSYVLDFLNTNSHFDFSKAQVRNSLKNVLFKVGGEETDQVLESHQVIREAMRRVCKIENIGQESGDGR